MGLRRLLNLILILPFLLIQINCSNKQDTLPDKILDLELTRKMTGEAAKESINQLHFQPVTETENEIGFYKGNIGKGIIYVTHYQNSDDPKSDYEKMTKKISPENSVFFNPSFFKHDGKTIYQCFGMGMTHFVFYHNTNLFWISIDTHIAREFLSNYLNYLTK
jgi:hypothetical protein